VNYTEEVEKLYDVRSWHSTMQEIRHEGGSPASVVVRAAAGVIFKNPFAGSYVHDISQLTRPSYTIGHALGQRAAALLGGRPVQSYGKGGIAGVLGEQEHIVACITTVFGDAFRQEVGGGEAWISSVSKVAAAGVSLDIPLAHKDELYIRSHYDAVNFSVADGPRPDELLICVAVSSGPRIHHRVGGKSVADLTANA
jgi:hypothetical protein